VLVKALAVEFRDACFEVDGQLLVGPVTFDVRRGETLVCLGRSGSGKTTTLRLVNRLIDPSAGTVMVDGRSTIDWNPTSLRRSIGYVIQDVGLFPHFTVTRNVAVVPRLERWSEDRVEARVTELLDLVGLPPQDFAGRYPHQLSGGQRQRVGVARALAADPPILLCDEPFGAVDPITRSDLQDEFKSLAARLGKTVIFVTHDVREAVALATRIALFDGGVVTFLGTLEEFRSSDEPGVLAFRRAL
jgi:osmoprotectant transport system ATP-binding protein